MTQSKKQIPGSWKNVKGIAEAKRLVDYGIILNWREAQRLVKSFSTEDGEEFVRHLALRLSENNETRLVDEMLVESLLGWLSHAPNERFMQVFLESFLMQPNGLHASYRLSEITLALELVDPEHDDEMFATAVTLICELGLAVQDLSKRFASQVGDVKPLLDHLATYLMSVSNTNSMRIRLSLINYFGAVESGVPQKIGFNKVLSRFGHTVLDQLFNLLFNKKTEAVALQFLLENLHFVFEGDRHAQTIIHETFKFYMLKQPERFGLFLRTFSDNFRNNSSVNNEMARKPFFQHMGALLRVVSEVNHKELAHILISLFASFENSPDRNEVIDALLALEDLRAPLKGYLKDIRNGGDTSKVIESTSRFVDAKRGRKPSFSRIDGWVTMNQVNYLGQQSVVLLKAS